MITLPNPGWKQTNRSDIAGNLMGTFNVDFTKVIGETQITRMIQTTSQTTGGAPQSTLTSYPVGFQVFNDGSSTKIWTAVGVAGVGKPHSSASAIANAAFVADATSGVPTDCDSTLSDIRAASLGTTLTLCVTANSKLYIRTTGNWTNTALTAGGGPWMTCAYGKRLYITIAGVSKIVSTADGSTIIAPTNAYALQLDMNLTPTFLSPASNKIWIGTIAKTGKGIISDWDGVATQTTKDYLLDAQGALACVIKDDTPWIMDTEGKLQVYSGGAFRNPEDIGLAPGRLPIDDRFLLNATNTVNNRFIHPNGMTVSNGKINILINNVIADSDSSIAEFCPSGIWEYDPAIGLYHKGSLSYLQVSTNTITDYGQNRLSGVGALVAMKLSNTATNATGDIIAGAVMYTNGSSSTDAGTFTNDTFIPVTGTYHATQGSGYIVTTKLQASEIQNTFSNLTLFYKQFLTSTDRITIKYRVTDVLATEISIIWTSTTTFTTTTDVSTMTGYEVEVLQGTGSGMCVHISAVSAPSGGVYTVTVDEIVTGVTTGTAKARLQNWIKLPFVIQDQTSYFKEMSINKPLSWIQLKIHFLFTGKNQFRKALLVNTPMEPAKK